MKYYHFGNLAAPAIFLLPGTCCHWKLNFGSVVPLLENDFHVVCVSYDGFDETEDVIFPDMLTETAKIEHYIQEHFHGHIHAAYGCSLGGSFVGLLVQRKNIHIDHAILGSSDLDQDVLWKAKLKCKIAVPLLHKIISTGEYPKILQGLMGEKYLIRYQKHFKDPVIHRFDMEHEELLVLHPEQWAKKVKEVAYEETIF